MKHPEDEDNDALIQTAREIAMDRRRMMDQLRHALEQDDDQTALAIARKLVGLEKGENEKSHRAHQSIN